MGIAACKPEGDEGALEVWGRAEPRGSCLASGLAGGYLSSHSGVTSQSSVPRPFLALVLET